MTRAATAGELVKLRSNGQWARWKVIIDDPDTVYTARATGAVNQTDWSISFDGGSGTLANCVYGMTLLVGSSSGGWERGITRLRKAPIAGKFYVGADPSIVCQDNDYLTVLGDFAPMARHPIGTLIDVDVAYTEQFTNFIPMVVMGERFAVCNAGATIEWDASNSWVPGSTITGYTWVFGGATSSTGTNTATPTATYNTSGRFRVDLTVTAATTVTAISYGWVYVLGPNLAAETGCIVTDVEAETEIGWACRVKAYDRPTIKDRARVIIYAEDYYANALGSIGPITDRENIVMVGWIVGETIIREPGQDYVEFTVGGPGVVCGNFATLPAGLTDSALPTDAGTTLPAWSKMASMNHQKGIHYLLNYRTSLPLCIDIEIENWNWPAHKLTADDDTFWGQLVTFAKHGMMTCTPDRYAHLYIQRDAALYTVADRTADIPVIMALGDSDWADDLSIVRRHSGDIGMAEAEGTIFAAGVLSPAGGRSPGEQPGTHGTVENVSEVNWPNLAAALEIAGLMAGRMNSEYEQIGVYHPSNNRFIDVAPRQYVNVTVDGSTLRCIPRRISQTRDDEGQITTELELEPEGGQWPAVSIDYPDDGSEPVQDPEEPPEFPEDPPGSDPDLPDEPSGADAVVVTTADVRITDDLDAGSPTWTSIISGGPAAPLDSDLPETTNDTLYVIEAESVWKCTGVTGTPAWTEVWTGDDLALGTIETLSRVRVAPGSDSLIYVLGAGTETSSGDIKPFVLRSSNGGSTWDESWIDDVLPEGTPYTVSYKEQTSVTPNNQSDPDWDYIDTNLEFQRLGDSESTHNPYALAYRWTKLAPISGGNVYFAASDSIAVGTEKFLIGGDSGLVYGTVNENAQTEGEDYLDDYFGVGNYQNDGPYSMPKTSGRTKQYWRNAAPGAGGVQAKLEVWVFWNIPDVSDPKALDVSRTNNNYVYVGTANKVWKSTDGAYTWVESQTTGANDICCDPQLAGVYYYWSAAGNLILCVNDIATAQLDTETAQEIPLRLARDLNSGKLWTLDSSTTLRKRENGSWSDQDTGLTSARGLHAYLGGLMIYLDQNDIYYSDDYGATQAAKKGAWAFADPINAHLMRVET